MPAATETKALHARLEIKDAAKGEVQAIVATIGVVDNDSDVIRPGALAKPATVVVSDYGHSAAYGGCPVGKGILSEKNGTLAFDGRIFLETDDGKDAFVVLKEMGADQEWSFGFITLGEEVPTDAEKKAGAYRAITKMEALEVSPVLRGAGIGTRTVSVKQADGDPTPPVAAVEVPLADPATETKTVTLEETRVQLKAARETVTTLERQEANLVATEIFQRFQRNMQSVKA